MTKHNIDHFQRHSSSQATGSKPLTTEELLGPRPTDFREGLEWDLAQDQLDERVPFVPGEANLEYAALVADSDSILEKSIIEVILRGLVRWGNINGESELYMTQFFGFHWEKNGGFDFFNERLQFYGSIEETTRGGGGFADFQEDITQQLGLSGVQGTMAGFGHLVDDVWRWFSGKSAADLGNFKDLQAPPARGPSGRGARGPTDQDIRNQFDISELAEAADNIWRTMLLEETPDARAMAKNYVDVIVKGRGEVKVDFREFVRDRAMKTARYAAIFINKPEELSPEDYLQRYAVAAQQVVRPGDASAIAIGGAQFGSDSATFAKRLRRSNANQNSSSYINEFQERLRGLNNVFKG